jgi:hypothetical protein
VSEWLKSSSLFRKRQRKLLSNISPPSSGRSQAQLGLIFEPEDWIYLFVLRFTGLHSVPFQKTELIIIITAVRTSNSIEWYCSHNPQTLWNFDRTKRDSLKISDSRSSTKEFLFGRNIFLGTLFSGILSLCSSLNVRDQVSHPYRTISRILVLYILIFTFLDSRREEKASVLMVASITQIQSVLNFLIRKGDALLWIGTETSSWHLEGGSWPSWGFSWQKTTSREVAQIILRTDRKYCPKFCYECYPRYRLHT